MQQQQQQQQQQHQASHQTGGRQAQHHLSPPPQLPAAAAVSTSGHVVSSNNVNVGNVGNMNNLGNVGVASVAVGHGFELEEALFATAPVGIHCVDANGVVLWANRTELNFLGFATKEEYVGRYVSSFVYSDKVKNDAAANNATNNSASTGGNGNNGNNNILGGQGGSTMGAVVGDTNLQQQQQQPEQQQQQGGGDPNVNLITADDKTLYKEVLKRVTGGNPISEIPVRFVTRSGTVIHLLLDCDGNGILQRHNTANNNNGRPGSTTGEYYYRFFTRDDTSRRIQEMRSNVLFQETNRSLQMLDNFMNRSMQQMRAPLTLMERACNLVTENIEDIDEVVRRNAMMVMQNNNNNNLGTGGNNDDASVTQHNNTNMRRSSSRLNLGCDTLGEEDGSMGKQPPMSALLGQLPSTPATGNNNAAMQHYSAPLSVALSATLEARSVVGLASTLTKDALALVDDITDLCRFDQGRVLLIEKEAVKVRDICVEALEKVSIPVGSGPGMVDVCLEIREGAPGRTMTDRSVLQRSLALLLNFAVDAAANAASTLSASGSFGGGKVILSVADAAEGQPRGTSQSACKVSVFYTNPPPDAADQSIGIMGSASSAAGGLNVENSATTAFASAYTPIGNRDVGYNNNNNNDGNLTSSGRPMIRGASYGKLPAIFGECYSKPMIDDNNHQNYHAASAEGCGSMMRRIRLRESIQSGMTSCRRDKLGLGLSLLYHLVGAQGSDLRYEIVSESLPPSASPGVHVPSMTKFWFLLPMSLDFPDRLPAEQIVKDNLNQVHPQHSPQHQPNNRQQQQPSSLSSAVPLPAARSSLLPSTFSMAPDDTGGLGNMQQQQQQQQQEPRRKRARTSSQPSVAAVDPQNSILSANVIGAAMGGNVSLYGHPKSASIPTAASSAASAVNALSVATKPPATKPSPPTRQYPGVMPGARPLVLVVEDTDVSASLLCMHLRKLNCTSHRAENGEVAIEMLRSAPAPNMYSLILMDLRMPVMDGFEATKIIKDSNACNIPVVALTGETSEENRQRCNEIGFDDYKTKPLKRPQLKELLNKLVPGYVSVG